MKGRHVPQNNDLTVLGAVSELERPSNRARVSNGHRRPGIRSDIFADPDRTVGDHAASKLDAEWVNGKRELVRITD